MDEMVRYIFNDLRTTNQVVRNMEKTIRRQKAVNRRLSFLMIVAVGCAALASIRCREQKIEIEDLSDQVDILSDRVEELKRMKGD